MVGSEHLHAEVQIMGCTSTEASEDEVVLKPLSYPVKPTSKVLYPDASIVNKLLSNKNSDEFPLKLEL